MHSSRVYSVRPILPGLLWSLQYECLYPVHDMSSSFFVDRTSFQFYSLVYLTPSSPNVHLHVCRRWRKSSSFSAREQLSNALEHFPKVPWFPSVTTGRYCSTKRLSSKPWFRTRRRLKQGTNTDWMYKCIAYFLCSCFSMILIEVPVCETEIQEKK